MRPLGVGVVMLVLSTSARPVVAAAQTSTTIALDTVLVSSGALRLSGLLWRPDGPGPFPAILFSHGDGAGIDAARARSRADAVGPVFAKHGYVLLYLFRRGFGLSAVQGESLCRSCWTGRPDAEDWKHASACSWFCSRRITSTTSWRVCRT